MGAEYLFCMKSIETHARAFLAHIILPLGTVMAEFFWKLQTKTWFLGVDTMPLSLKNLLLIM